MMRPLIVVISTTRYAIDRFVLPALDELQLTYDIVSINGESADPFTLSCGRRIECFYIPLNRKISLFFDFIAFFKLIVLLIKLRPGLVQTFTPKGGLVGIIAALLASVPRRVHYFTGQVWANYSGLRRAVFKFIDWLIVKSSTATLADSESQLHFLIKSKVVNKKKCFVLGMGSLGGVDIEKFKANKDYYFKKRSEMGLASDAYVILYMARITVDKGALGLVRSFKKYRANGGRGLLLCVGPDEENLVEKLRIELGSACAFVRFVGYTDTPELYFKISDVFFMPSLREGFGSVYLLAGACSLPSIGSEIYGTVDAIVDNHTGFYFKHDNYDDFAKCLYRLEHDIDLRNAVGIAARERVEKNFSISTFNDAYKLFINSLF